MNTRRIKIPTLVWHVAGCIAFLAIPIVFAPRPPHMSVFSQPTLRDVSANIFMLLIFYANFYFLIPKLYFRHKLFAYALTLVAGLLIITFIPPLITGYFHLNPPGPPPFHGYGVPPPGPGRFQEIARPFRDDSSFVMQVRHNFILYLAVTLFSIFLRTRMKLLDTETLKHHAEVGTLKNQINPHFLFNTLNNIYAFAVREKASQTASSILKLSAMMRYVVTETSADYVPLEKEINYTNDYIDLQKMRVTQTLHLSYTIAGSITDQKIAPMVLMPFVENAFKHGVNPDEESYISIRLDIAKDHLELTTENKKVKMNRSLNEQSGVGIENTRARLDLLYPHKYNLAIHDEQDHYRVKLNVQLS